MKSRVKEIAKIFGVEIGEKFYLCHFDDTRYSVGQYFFDEDDVLVRDTGEGLSFNNDFELWNMMSGFYIPCKFDVKSGYQPIGGNC